MSAFPHLVHVLWIFFIYLILHLHFPSSSLLHLGGFYIIACPLSWECNHRIEVVGLRSIIHHRTPMCALQTKQLYRLMLLFSSLFIVLIFCRSYFCVNALSQLFSAETKSVIIKKLFIAHKMRSRAYLFSENWIAHCSFLSLKEIIIFFYYFDFMLSPFTSMQFTWNGYKTVFLVSFFSFFFNRFIASLLSFVFLPEWRMNNLPWLFKKRNTYMERSAGKGEQLNKKEKALQVTCAIASVEKS